jgi:predicted nucleic acid-binding protein
VALVIDASVTACWAFDDEDHATAARARERLETEDAWVPSLWFFEVRNSLIVAERRGRVDEAHVSRFLGLLARLPIQIDYDPVDGDLMNMARQRRLTAYDAAYLELARRKGAPLATLDRALATAASSADVALV